MQRSNFTIPHGGDIKKRINTRKFKVLGAKPKDVDGLKKHFEFCKNLEHGMCDTKEVPAWLQ